MLRAFLLPFYILYPIALSPPVKCLHFSIYGKWSYSVGCQIYDTLLLLFIVNLYFYLVDNVFASKILIYRAVILYFIGIYLAVWQYPYRHFSICSRRSWRTFALSEQMTLPDGWSLRTRFRRLKPCSDNSPTRNVKTCFRATFASS